MKKLFTLLVAGISFASVAQSELKIIHEKDDMTKKEYWHASRKLIVENKKELKAFGITFYIDKDKTGALSFDMIDAKLIGFKCVENVEFIFMFENDETLTKKSPTKFNCTGAVVSWLTPDDIDKFSRLKVKKIRATNGRDGSSVTQELSEQDYFMKLINLLKENKITEK